LKLAEKIKLARALAGIPSKKAEIIDSN